MSRDSRNRSLRELMDVRGVGALLLSSPANFAWYTGGADNRVNPAAQQEIRESQAFAWNPSLEGAKAEETFVLGLIGPEVLARS